jgi:hypothetical protein
VTPKSDHAGLEFIHWYNIINNVISQWHVEGTSSLQEVELSTTFHVWSLHYKVFWRREMDFKLWIWNLNSQAQVAQNNWGSLFLPVEHNIIPMQGSLRELFLMNFNVKIQNEHQEHIQIRFCWQCIHLIIATSSKTEVKTDSRILSSVSLAEMKGKIKL